MCVITLGKLVNTQTKGITLLCIGKNNICISCVLMALSIHAWEKTYIDIIYFVITYYFMNLVVSV